MTRYETWLEELETEVQAEIADAENREWHHAGDTTGEWRHYSQLLAWAAQIAIRRKWVDDTSRR